MIDLFSGILQKELSIFFDIDSCNYDYGLLWLPVIGGLRDPLEVGPGRWSCWFVFYIFQAFP